MCRLWACSGQLPKAARPSLRSHASVPLAHTGGALSFHANVLEGAKAEVGRPFCLGVCIFAIRNPLHSTVFQHRIAQ